MTAERVLVPTKLANRYLNPRCTELTFSFFLHACGVGAPHGRAENLRKGSENKGN